MSVLILLFTLQDDVNWLQTRAIECARCPRAALGTWAFVHVPCPPAKNPVISRILRRCQSRVLQMKDTIKDASKPSYHFKWTLQGRGISPLTLAFTADFPTTAEGRVYHLGLRYGEVANRIVSR